MGLSQTFPLSLLLCALLTWGSITPLGAAESHCIQELEQDWLVSGPDGDLVPFIQELHGGTDRAFLNLSQYTIPDVYLRMHLKEGTYVFINQRLIQVVQKDGFFQRPIKNLKAQALDSEGGVYFQLVYPEGPLAINRACLALLDPERTASPQAHQSILNQWPNMRYEGYRSQNILFIFGLALVGLVVSYMPTSSSRKNLMTKENQGFTNLLAVTFQAKDLLHLLYAILGLSLTYSLLAYYSSEFNLSINLPLRQMPYLLAFFYTALVLTIYLALKVLVVSVVSFLMRFSSIFNLHLILYSRFIFWMAAGMLALYGVLTITYGIWPIQGLKNIWVLLSLYKILFCVYLFIQVKKSVESRNVYIISYICATEILPALMVGRFLASQFPE